MATATATESKTKPRSKATSRGPAGSPAQGTTTTRAARTGPEMRAAARFARACEAIGERPEGSLILRRLGVSGGNAAEIAESLAIDAASAQSCLRAFTRQKLVSATSAGKSPSYVLTPAGQQWATFAGGYQD